jgi:leucyl/phenylalanyl-tRNA--protein transferase
MWFERKHRTTVEMDFPWLGEYEYFQFPAVRTASPEGIVCVGGNLSPGMLLSAYRQGIFPWYSDDDPILWWSPDPRFIVDPTKTHLSQTMRKLLRRKPFELKLDTAFSAVIQACAAVPRNDQNGTWIGPDMIEAYNCLHQLGYAHSAEAWQDGVLVGGLYGLSLGGAFFGESMFSLVNDASKAVFLPLAWFLASKGYRLIDSQVHTSHVESLGGYHVRRQAYLNLLQSCQTAPEQTGSWAQRWTDFPQCPEYRARLGLD